MLTLAFCVIRGVRSFAKLICSVAASCFLLLFLADLGSGLLLAQDQVTVQANNLTHPDLSPSFLAGDTYQYVISGPPNQPVYNVQNSGPMNQVGQTDSNGYYVTTGVEQPEWVGSYTQDWYVGNVQAAPALSFTVSFAAVVARNVTHPDLSPNFIAGDTYQYTVYGPPNQPVYIVQNSSPLTAVGQTDGNGVYVTTGVEQTAWIGSYTQVWSVGNNQASPALSFAVGQFNNSGTVTTTDIGWTSDGHLEGVSSLSISNGIVSTYSATTLDYTASLYYDSYTNATLFDERVPISGAVSQIDSSTWATLSASVTPWHDYDLQTYHYAVAYFLYGGYYANPLYWGTDCYTESGDCTIGGGGGYAYWIGAAAIYIGSTLADQGYVPPDGSLPPFDMNDYSGFLAASQPAYPSLLVLKIEMDKWFKLIKTIYVPVRIYTNVSNPNDSPSIPPIPFYVDLQEDHFDLVRGERQRLFLIKDIYGNPWNTNFPLRIRERFTNVSYFVGTTPPVPDGVWDNRVPAISRQDEPIDSESRYLDHYAGNPAAILSQSSFLHFYYATDFTLPSYETELGGLFTLSGLSGIPSDVSGPAMPLLIKDTLNKCTKNSTFFPAVGVTLVVQNVYVNGDNGPGTGCRVP